MLTAPLLSSDYTIKRINKGLKHIAVFKKELENYTIKRINKGLKHDTI